MRRLLFVAFCMALLGALGFAQKIDTKWHCSKPTTNPTMDVGDTPGHVYALAQGTCSATSSGSGEKSGAYTEFDEISKASMTGHGRFNVTMENGDMAYYSYDTSAPADMKKPATNKWKIVSGTGKHKGVTGTGSCSGIRNDDGSSDWTCKGTTAGAAAKSKENE
ncbi:MAG: hypothetical protein WBS24_18620 [Terriglobales bacterium]